jgi:hypothetical protein
VLWEGVLRWDVLGNGSECVDWMCVVAMGVEGEKRMEPAGNCCITCMGTYKYYMI